MALEVSLHKRQRPKRARGVDRHVEHRETDRARTLTP
jgi:hypothetical protein